MAKSTQVQGTGSIYTKRQQKQHGNRDGGGKQRKKRGTFAKVHCDAHGVMPVDGKGFKEVRVPIPQTRAQRYKLGCPACAQLKHAQA